MKIMSKIERAIRIREKLLRNWISLEFKTTIDKMFPNKPISTVMGVTRTSMMEAKVNSIAKTCKKKKNQLSLIEISFVIQFLSTSTFQNSAFIWCTENCPNSPYFEPQTGTYDAWWTYVRTYLLNKVCLTNTAWNTISFNYENSTLLEKLFVKSMCNILIHSNQIHNVGTT